MKKEERIYFIDECDTVCIDSKDTKKRELTLAKEEYKNLTQFIDRDLNEQYASAARHYAFLGASYANAGLTLTSGVICDQPALIIASGAVFLASLGATGIELFAGPRKERKERIKSLKKAKQKYKDMYEDRVFEINENYLMNKEDEGKKPYVKK